MQAWTLFLVSIERGTSRRVYHRRPWLSDTSQLGGAPCWLLARPGCGTRRCRRTEARKALFRVGFSVSVPWTPLLRAERARRGLAPVNRQSGYVEPMFARSSAVVRSPRVSPVRLYRVRVRDHRSCTILPDRLIIVVDLGRFRPADLPVRALAWSRG